MNKVEAKELLTREITRLRTQTYTQLQQLNGDSQHTETAGPSGKEYQVEIQAWWDDRKQQNLRVMVSIDDGGLRAIVPLTESFIVAPDGSFVGE
jgi:hypothetical protein